MRVSVLRPISFGYAASNRSGSHFIEVCPIEPLAFLGGEVNASVNRINETGEDGDGKKYTVTLEFGNTLSAKWLPEDNTNRITPPDVRVGERVMIYRFADSDQYFWRTLGMDNYLRRLETVIYAFSATEEETEELNSDNCYFFEVSTHSKHITLSTSKVNGEPFAYTIQIDTGEGIITITDDAGNFFTMNSQERQLRLENGDGSFLFIDKRNGHLNIPDTYKVTCKDYKMEASNSISEKTKTKTTDASISITEKTTDHSLSASSKSTVKTSTFTVSASAAKITAAISLVGGITSTGGNMSMAGNLVTKGNITAINGDFKGNLFSMGKNVGGTHKHLSASPGNPSSPPM